MDSGDRSLQARREYVMIPVMGGAIKGWDKMRSIHAYNPRGSAFSFGNALHFNGANSVVTGNVNSVLSGLSTFCMEFWFKNDTSAFGATGRYLVNSINSAGSLGWGVAGISGGKKIRVPVSNGSVAYGEYTFSAIDTWNHCRIVYDGNLSGNSNRLTMAVNGVPIAFDLFSGTIPATVGTSGVPIRFGRFVTTLAYYDGWLDNFCLWNDAVGSDTWAGGAGAAPTTTNLIVYCKFDESNPSATTLDETGNNIFTLTNFNYDANDGFGAH